jgi:hypothetical protein
VRPPDERAPARLTSVVPRARPVLLALCAALTLGVAGCGGSDVGYEEVTSPPPTLPIPNNNAAASPSSTPDANASPTATPTATASSGASSGASTGGTSSGTGTTTAPAPTATTAPSTGTGTGTGGTTTGGGTTQQQSSGADTGGATADQGLDQFCADNPGACDNGN